MQFIHAELMQAIMNRWNIIMSCAREMCVLYKQPDYSELHY